MTHPQHHNIGLFAHHYSRRKRVYRVLRGHLKGHLISS
jgi:hypothetical protein